MAFASFTRLRVRAWYYLPAFLVHAERSGRQAQRANDYRGGALSADFARLTFWTLTLWSNEAAMRAYRIAEPHKSVMRRIRWCDEAAVAHREQPTEQLPGDDDVLQFMREHGRVVKVPYPSSEHAAGLTVPDGRPPRFARPLRPVTRS
jgi:hypothetical protein